MSIYGSRHITQQRRPGAGIFVKTPGKALFALLTEIDLGLPVYPATNHDVVVRREGNQYLFQRLNPRNGGTELEKGEFPPERNQYVHVLSKDRPASGQVVQTMTLVYDSFSDLLMDWPRLSALAVWSTQMTPERLAWRPVRFTL